MNFSNGCHTHARIVQSAICSLEQIWKYVAEKFNSTLNLFVKYTYFVFMCAMGGRRMAIKIHKSIIKTDGKGAIP